ncbi:MAG: ASCH domain-containing protein [Pseudomonadota bacterium]
MTDEALRAWVERAIPGGGARTYGLIFDTAPPALQAQLNALVLAGTKTATATAPWMAAWTERPTTGVLSVLADLDGRPIGIVETTRLVEITVADITEAMVRDYGEGDRTLDWWHREAAPWYAAEARTAGHAFGPRTPLLWEWFRLVHPG